MEIDWVTMVRQWPIPKTIKELQRFLVIANFYHRFIRNLFICSVATPLTVLLKGKPSFLRWMSEADHAFNDLKFKFTTAPTLHLPDPDKSFVLKADASETVVGAILLQRRG